jgi:hypothetical protein
LPSRARSLPIVFLSFLLASCGGRGGDDPPTLYVTTLADAGPGSLRQVVDDAPAGSQIYVDAAIAGGTIDLLSPIVIDKPLRIDGGPMFSETTIHGASATQIFRVENADPVHLQSMILSDGSTAESGAAIAVWSSTVRLWRVRITNCIASDLGGGLWATDSDVEMSHCLLTACIAQYGGAIYLDGGRSLIEHTSVTWSIAQDGIGGGLLFDGGAHALRSCTVHACTAIGTDLSDGGGGIAAFGGPMRLGVYGCTITGNTSGEKGGGVYLGGEVVESQCEFRQSILAENTAPSDPDLGLGMMISLTGAWNLVGVAAVGPIADGVDGNIVGDAVTPVDPMLGPIGGAAGTFSRPPLAGSPVLDVVPHAEVVDELGEPLLFDQRFVERTADAAADVGAVEAVP